MSKSRANVAVALAPSAAAALPLADSLVHVFNQVKEELLGTLVYLLGSHEDAQDAAQDTFMKCWRSQDSLAEVQNLRAWIFRVALNTATDIQRSAWRRKAKPLAEEEMLPSRTAAPPNQPLEDREDLERLRRALHGLRQEEKEVFLLRQNGEMTYEQIAELRSLPVGTVKTQMRSALQKLRKVLT